MSLILENPEIFHVLLVLVNSHPANCDSLMELGQSFTSTNDSRFPEACLERRNSCALKYFGVLHLVLSRRKLYCENLSSPFFFHNFYNAFFQRRDWYVMMVRLVCQNSFALRTSTFST